MFTERRSMGQRRSQRAPARPRAFHGALQRGAEMFTGNLAWSRTACRVPQRCVTPLTKALVPHLSFLQVDANRRGDGLH